jgi:NAD(P)H-dependent FMN reductase
MTSNLTVKVILGTTREGRFGDKPAHWILGEAAKLPGVEAELLDLRDFPLPFFDRPKSPGREGGVYPHPVVTRWAEQIAKADAYIVVSPEYNHGGDHVALFFDDLLWATRALKAARASG